MRCLVSSVREMNKGVRRKNSETPKYMYLLCPPFAAKTARQRRLMLQISFLMSCNGILTHSACNARSRSPMLTSWCSLTLRPKWSHKCSMGERSGDLAGHCNALTLWSHKMFWVCPADGHYQVGKSQHYVVANTVQQQALNSVISAECQHRDGTLSIEQRVAYS